MAKKAGRKGTSAVLELKGPLSVERAVELKDAIAGALEGASELTLELKGVAGADLAGLQLLCSAHKSAMEGGKALRLKGMPDAFWQMVVDSGFSRARACDGKLYAECFFCVETKTNKKR
jgi:anti-anti-sigma regulatory factor